MPKISRILKKLEIYNIKSEDSGLHAVGGVSGLHLQSRAIPGRGYFTPLSIKRIHDL